MKFRFGEENPPVERRDVDDLREDLAQAGICFSFARGNLFVARHELFQSFCYGGVQGVEVYEAAEFLPVWAFGEEQCYACDVPGVCLHSFRSSELCCGRCIAASCLGRDSFPFVALEKLEGEEDV